MQAVDQPTIFMCPAPRTIVADDKTATWGISIRMVMPAWLFSAGGPARLSCRLVASMVGGIETRIEARAHSHPRATWTATDLTQKLLNLGWPKWMTASCARFEEFNMVARGILANCLFSARPRYYFRIEANAGVSKERN